MKVITCRIERCLGCKSCEIACSVEHSKTKVLVSAIQEDPLPRQRIRVLNTGIKDGTYRLKSIALQCRHCDEPFCVDACIAGGITKDPETGVVHFNRENCVGCWSCTMVCPFGAIVRLQDGKVAIKCDRCPDRDVPACVEACPTGALVFGEPEEFSILLDEKESDDSP